MFASPVPTHTMSGLDGATAIAPMAVDGSSSKMGAQLVPSFSLFHTPPDAVAT